jgi:AcrR family transcriptional regulator
MPPGKKLLSPEPAGSGRQEILVAAARAFMTKGYAGTSIDSVAEVLGCTKGRIYYEYKAKADLFFEVQDEAMQMNIRAVAPHAMAGGPARERLRLMLEGQLALVMTQLPFQRVLVQGVEMHLQGPTTVEQRAVLARQIKHRDAYEKLFVKVLADGVRRGEFRAVKPRIFVKVLLGSLIWVTVWYRQRTGETAAAREALARELADYMMEGLTSA